MPDLFLLDLQLGDPATHRGITIAPLFPRRDPRAGYVTLEEAIPLGLEIKEVSESGSVPDLEVVNPTPHRVLLVDGEELVGAKQNRILDVSVLVDAKSELVVPVSCVEQGRWSRRSRTFAPARHASTPELRKRKADLLYDMAAHPGARRGAAQREVWAAVADKSARMAAASPTGAQADVFAARAADTDDLARRFPAKPGQCGAVLAIGGRPVCVDAVSRPDAWARIYRKVLSGYMLDAIESLDGPATPRTALEDFLASLGTSEGARRPGVAVGENLDLRGDGLSATALVLDDEVLQVSAYAG